MALRNGKRVQPPPPVADKPASKKRKGSAKQGRSVMQDLGSSNTKDDQRSDAGNPDDHEEANTFISSFPALNLENYESQLDQWTIVELWKALVDQKTKRTKHKTQSPTEIKNLVEVIRIGYEKRMLMAALMGGISETMVWSLVYVDLCSYMHICFISIFVLFGK